MSHPCSRFVDILSFWKPEDQCLLANRRRIAAMQGPIIGGGSLPRAQGTPEIPSVFKKEGPP
jgi:hypothetical protein